MKRSAKGYNGTTAMSRQSPDVTKRMRLWPIEPRSLCACDVEVASMCVLTSIRRAGLAEAFEIKPFPYDQANNYFMGNGSPV